MMAEFSILSGTSMQHLSSPPLPPEVCGLTLSLPLVPRPGCDGGVVVLHTHLPGFYYHPYPRDYFRFHPDWFEDIPKFILGCEMLELYTVNGHVFAAYRKVAV